MTIVANLAAFIATEFLPLQKDGGMWRHKDPVETAIHYLKSMADRIEALERDVKELEGEVRSLSL